MARLNMSIILSSIILIIGVLGTILNRSSLINMIICIELMFLGAIMLFISGVCGLSQLEGQVFVIAIVAVATAESALGLAIIVNYHRLRGDISVRALNLLRG